MTWRELRNSFFAGLLVILPVAGSILILWWLFTFVTDFLLPVSLRDHMLTPLYRLAALVVFVLLTTLVGYVTRLVYGKRLLALTEVLIGRIPMLNKTYGFMKEVSTTLLAGGKSAFQRVVLVEYPRQGVYTIGFVTGQTRGEAQAKTRDTVLNVFFPTTPNPTSGWLALVPRDQIIDLDMSVADGMKLIVSGGVVVPTAAPGSRPPDAAAPPVPPPAP